MSRLSLGQKAGRVLRFIVGVRNQVVFDALAQHGFTEADILDGWDRLAKLTRGKLGVQAPVGNPRLIREIDEFENQWFPIARYTLRNRYPAIANALFDRLGQTSGLATALSVTTFVERIEQMERGEGPFAKDGPAARALLAERGLTPERIEQARSLIAALTAPRERTGATPEDHKENEEALWAWYLEWSGIARHVVKDGRHLRAMGFLQGRRSGDELEETDEAETGNEAPNVAGTAPALPGPQPQENGAPRALPAAPASRSNGSASVS